MKRKEMLDSLKEILKKNSDLQNDQILLVKNLMEEILTRLDSIKEHICSTCPKEVEGSTDEPKEREVILQSEAADLLGGFRNKSLKFLLARGAEGYQKMGRNYIYKDSIQNLVRKKRTHRPGRITLGGVARRCDRPYKEVRKMCDANGIPYFDDHGTLWMTEADSARVVLKYKI